MRAQIATAAAAAALSLLSTQAGATLQIAISADGASLFCADNTACDSNPAVGTLQLPDQNIGGVDVHGSIQTSSTGTGGSLLTASSLSLVNNSGADVPIDVTVSDRNYLGPASLVSTTGSGTFTTAIGSSITYSYFDDPNNAQGANSPGDTPGTKVDSFSASITQPLQSISHNFGPVPVDDPANFSMTLDASGTLTNGGSFLNRGQAIAKNHVEVMEPASFALLGGALLMLLGLRRWR